MKRGGRCLVLSIFCLIFTLVVSLVTISPSAYADEATDNSSQATEQTDASGQDSTQDNSGEQAEDSEQTCEGSFFGFGWLLCPGQNLITTIFSNFLGFIADALEWTMLSDNTEVIRDIWQDFLNIANIVFAIIFLIMIYSMATSTGLSSYDIKKLLPRLIIVALVINTSFYICAALADVSNIVGRGVYDLLTSRMEGSSADSLDLNIATSILGIVGGVIAIIFLGGAAIVALIIILIAITFRQVALMLLVIISPVAFALYTLPNTEKIGKMWFDAFTRMLFVYPMFMAVWGGSQLVANIVARTDPDGGLSIVSFMTSILCAIAPALAILPLFRSAGNVMGTVTGAMQKSNAAKKSSAAITSGIKRTAPVSRGRRGMSNIALGAQNAFGDVPVIGSILRGPAANRIVNYNRDFAAEQDKKAMGSADNWVKGLSNEQLSSLATTGSYINDNGRRTTISDTHKLRAAFAAAKDSLTADEWHKSMRFVNDRAAWLDNAGRGIEASQLRHAFSSNAMASKAMVITGGALSSFADGEWDSAHFEAEYGRNAAKFAGRLSSTKFATMAPAAYSDMTSSMFHALDPNNTRGMTPEKINEIRNDVRAGSEKAKAQASKILNDPSTQRVQRDMNDANMKNIQQAANYMRLGSEQDIADKYNLDQLFSNYNTQVDNLREAIKSGDINQINQAKTSLYQATAPAKSFMRNKDYNAAMQADFEHMSNGDKERLASISRFTVNTSPDPVTTW